jgi:hypothetical protein
MTTLPRRSLLSAEKRVSEYKSHHMFMIKQFTLRAVTKVFLYQQGFTGKPRGGLRNIIY